MMYPFMTLDDGTEIVHSEQHSDGSVKVYFETPNEKDGFHNAVRRLPQSVWEDVNGYSDEDMKRYKKCILDNTQVIMEIAKQY